METKDVLKTVSTVDLLHELKRRDMDKELGEEKAKWLKDNGYFLVPEIQYINLDFIDYDKAYWKNFGFTFEYLLGHDVDELSVSVWGQATTIQRKE